MFVFLRYTVYIMQSDEIRKRFLEFFKKRGHAIIPSASLVPENDPTTLFTGSGMQSLLPYLLGKKHPQGTRLANSQKSFRAQDIDEVGDNRHTTFFEMLGNWSLGDYFKKEQLRGLFEFLTKEIGLPAERLYVTVFIGDKKAGVPKDTESALLWKQLFAEKGISAAEIEMGSENDGSVKGMRGGRIFFYDDKKNWWNRGKPSLETTPTGDPAGPDSEVFYDFGTPHDKTFGTECHPNCDCGRFMEIGNSVFMEYRKNSDGSFVPLTQKNVDFGGGLERITAASLNSPDIFMIDIFSKPLQIIKENSYAGANIYDDPTLKRAVRIVLDHMRAAIFLIADGVIPGPKEKNFVVRTLLKRMVLNADILAFKKDITRDVVSAFLSSYQNAHPMLSEKQEYICATIQSERERISKTLEETFKKLKTKHSPQDIFNLYQSEGLDLESARALLERLSIRIDWGEIKKYIEEHKKISRAGAEKKFKGGLSGHGDKEIQYHTATHLLHQALRAVLGERVFQKGSNITPERLRFDFSYDKKMTDAEKKKVEDIINQKISEALPVSWEEMSIEDAKKSGAIGLFNDQYGERVRVYQIGNEEAGVFSLEFCGGPHVENTSELIGTFKIKKEEAVSAGVRRIKAVLE